MKEVHISAIGLDRSNGDPVVVLQDAEKKRVLPIWVGIPEARAISVALSKVTVPRPLTHNLLLEAISSLGYVVREIAIDRLEDGVFKATITLQSLETGLNKPPVHLDSRPSDALAIAAVTDAPLFVAPDIFARASIPADSESDEKETEAFREFLRDVMASDFNSALVSFPEDEDDLGDRRED